MERNAARCAVGISDYSKVEHRGDTFLPVYDANALISVETEEPSARF